MSSVWKLHANLWARIVWHAQDLTANRATGVDIPLITSRAQASDQKMPHNDNLHLSMIRRCCATGRERYASLAAGPECQRGKSGPHHSNLKPIQKKPLQTHTKQQLKKTMSPSVIASRSPSPEPEDDGFFNFGEDFVKSPKHLAASIQSIDFGGLLNPPLLLHEDLAAGCGGMLWPAGMRLAKYILKLKQEEIRTAESMCVANLWSCDCLAIVRSPMIDVSFFFSVDLNSALEAVWSGE